MKTSQKITIEVPRELLQRALKTTGKGTAATIRQGLELVAASAAYDGIQKLRGRIRLKLDVGRLREDRD
jgi:hypothetical protein